MKRELIPVCMLSAAVALSALPTNFKRTAWVTGIPTAAAMAFAPDGRLFIAGDNGAIRIVKNGKLLPGAFATVKSRQRGGSLSGIAFDPDFRQNGYVYIVYTYNLAAGGQDDRVSRITSDKANPDAAVTGSELILLEGLGGGGHFSGALHFGKDRMLYVASPTSTAAGHDAGQKTDNLHAKVLRINPAAYPNIIPPDNPFVGKPGARGEVWALGFREPFSGAIDTVTGTYVINDVGDGKTEEIDVVTKGANYGYPVCEGACNKAGFTDPWASWNHNGMACIAGGAFYYGSNFPAEYRGTYFASDEQEKVIKWRGPDGKIAVWDNLTGSVVDIDVGPDGGLYYLGYAEHTVFRVLYGGSTAIRAVAAPDGIGPEASLIRRASADGVRFRLGDGQVSGASLEIFTRQGRRIASIESGAGVGTLLWPFNGTASGPDTYLYSLKATAGDGKTSLRSGKIVIIE